MQGNRARSISFCIWRRKSRKTPYKLTKFDQNLSRVTLMIENKVLIMDGNCMDGRAYPLIQQNAKKK